MGSSSQDMGSACIHSQDDLSSNMKEAACQSRKRKRDVDEQSGPSDLFDARILFTSATSASSNVSFSQIAPILRAHLPFSWLAPKSISNILPPGTFLEAIIESVPRWGYQVLVARHEPNGALYVFEKIESDVFICHPLRAWVTTEWIQQAAIGAAPIADLNLLLKSIGGQSHSRQVSGSSASSLPQLPTAPSSPKHLQNRRGVLARKSILEKEKRLETQIKISSLQTDPGGKIAPDNEKGESQMIVPEVRTQASNQDTNQQQGDTLSILEQPHVKDMSMDIIEVDHLSPEYLRKRFLETLYLCKTTLAFYAKGPLSRTRARMRIPGSSISSEQLATHYQDIILPAKKMDLKYKDSIKTKIMALSQRPLFDEDSNPGQIKRPKRAKKIKLGKNGLWSIEEELIEQWWRKRDYKRNTSMSSEGQSSEMKDALTQLRMRETELQIILILEVMALEMKDNIKDDIAQAPNSDACTEVKVEPFESNDASLVLETIQPKKKRDLTTELDNLLDRLCIWHTVGIDENDTTSSKDSASGRSSSATMKDRLSDFCKDVVVPFYGGKLPDQCKSICKKLGGPEISSQRPASASTARPTPGSVIISRKPHTNKRTLERVLSEDQGARHFSPPSFSRSSTLPLAPTLRRESSEHPVSRSNRQKSISFSNREIDLVADANATAAKRRKLEIIAAQKRELDAAIEALKKPNRSMLAKDYMDGVENRTVDKSSSMKRIEPVQIRATPRHDRVRVDEEEYELPPLPFAMSPHGGSIVPSSAKKQRESGNPSSVSRYSAKKKAVLSAISDMPQRPQLRHWDSTGSDSQNDMGLRITKSQSSSTIVISTPATNRRRTDLDYTDTDTLTSLPTYKIHKEISSSSSQPVGVSAMASFKDIPSIPQAAGRAMDRVMMRGIIKVDDESIYDRLGWNDDMEI